MRNQSVWVPGGVWSQGWNLKELTEGHHKMWILWLNLTQHRKTYQVQTISRRPQWKLDFLGFLDVRSAFSSNCFCIDGGPIGGLEPGTSLIEERLQNHHKTIGPLLSNHLASCPISSHYVFTNTRPQVSYSTWKVIYRTQFHSNITISGRS